MSDLVALIPLRGGSKSIPDKNIKLLAGKPLCSWVLEAAHLSGIFDRIIVSTDSWRIAEVVNSLGMPVEVLMRPAELATDDATTESVMLHVLSKVSCDTLVTIQATSPLLNSEDFVKARAFFINNGFDSLLTGVRTKRFYWSGEGVPLNYNPLQRPMRQAFEGTLMENGAFYFTKSFILQQYGCRLGGKMGVYEMHQDTAVELDEPEDWKHIEQIMMKRRHNAVTDILGRLRLLVVDVDGTLTDAGMYWSPNGDFLKKFNTRDAKGLELIRKCGVETAIITTEDSPIVMSRARKLGIDYCFTGISDKLSCLIKLCDDLKVTFAETAYVGDDVNDFECMNNVGFSACPADATPKIRGLANYVSSLMGGEGAVRDICELIMQYR